MKFGIVKKKFLIHNSIFCGLTNRVIFFRKIQKKTQKIRTLPLTHELNLYIFGSFG